MKSESVQAAQAAAAPKKTKKTAPKDGLIKAGPKTWKDDRYEFKFSKGELLITDTTNGSTSKIWGDPHLWTGDDDKLGFHKENLTLDLKNGTKLTLIPTEVDANGVSWLDKVQIMTPKRAIVVGEISGTGPQVIERSKDSASIDKTAIDGNVLVAGDEVDDWFTTMGKELAGTDGGKDIQLDGLGGESGIDFSTTGKGGGGDPADGVIDSIKGMIKSTNREITDLKEKFENASAEDKPLVLQELQDAFQRRSMLYQMMSNLSKTESDTLLAIARNLRT